MKTLLLLFVLSLPSIDTSAQNPGYHPFIEEGKVWTVGRYPMGDSHLTPSSFSQYYFDGDTIIGGRICKRWMKDGELIAPLYEEDRRVYLFRKGESTPRLLYSFSAQKGDEIAAFSFIESEETVCHVDSVYLTGVDDKLHAYRLYDDIVYDRYWNKVFESKDYNEADSMEYSSRFKEMYCYTWIEGVGGDVPLEDNHVGIEGWSGNVECLIQVRVGDIIIYEIPDANWGENGIATTECTEKSGHSQAVYDLSGRRIGDGQRGLKIQGGKKFLVPLQ